MPAPWSPPRPPWSQCPRPAAIAEKIRSNSERFSNWSSHPPIECPIWSSTSSSFPGQVHDRVHQFPGRQRYSTTWPPPSCAADRAEPARPVLLWIVKNGIPRNSPASSMTDHPAPPQRHFLRIDYEALQAASARRIPLANPERGHDLIADLLATADPETARDLANTLLLNQARGLTKSRCSPASSRFSRTSSPRGRGRRGQGGAAAGLPRELRPPPDEYEAIVSKKIPENSAPSHRPRARRSAENSEFKMAKQDQSMLMAQKTSSSATWPGPRHDFKDARPTRSRRQRSSSACPTARRRLLHPRSLDGSGTQHRFLQDPLGAPSWQEGRRCLK